MPDILFTYSDGGARGNPGPAAVGVVLCDENNKVLFETARCIGEATNNVAEYNGMLLALQLAKERKAKRLLCHADSELLVFQLTGIYRIKNLRLKDLAEKVKSLASQFEKVTYRQIPRESLMIARADKLLNQALNKGGVSLRTPSDSGPPQGEFF